MPIAKEKLYQKGVALGQFAAIWTAFYVLRETFPKGDAPILLGFAWAAGWMYTLADGVHRIAHNLPIWKANELTKKEEKRKEKKKSLAHAVSHEGASKD